MHESRRQLGLLPATAAVVGEAIGSGVFLTAASVAVAMGTPVAALALWAAFGVMTVCGALTFAELAVRFPEDGGEVVYLDRGYGPMPAFLAGWLGAITLLPGVAAAMAYGSTAYLAALFPVPLLLVRILPAVLLLVLAAVNLLGTAISGRLVSALTVLKILLLAGLVFFTLLSGHARWSNFHASRPGPHLAFGAIAGASIAVFFSVSGWWDAVKLAGEVRDPGRTLPRALAGGVVLMMALYMLLTLCLCLVTPVTAMTAGAEGVAQFSRVLFGALGSRLVSGAVALCIFGALAVVSLAAPRITNAMAREGTFFQGFSSLHPRFHTPARSILLHTALALLVLLLGAFDRILGYVSFGAVLALAATATVVFRIQPRPRAWWFPVAPVLFIAGCMAVAVMVAVHDPTAALLGSALIAVGYPIGLWIRRHRDA